MQVINSIEELESLYEPVAPGPLSKVCDHITPHYHRWINGSSFLILSTVGPEGTDGSPRGDSDSAVRIVDKHTLWLPDWRGNNRMDSLRNIVSDGRVSLMFMISGSNNVVRVNGTANLTAQIEITSQFDKNNKSPRSVIVVTVNEIYFQCAKALMRSKLWVSGDNSKGIPTAGQFIQELRDDFDAESYDESYPEYAKDRMW
jgi:uncharacterized protein